MINIILSAIVATLSVTTLSFAENLSEKEIQDIAIESYIYGYPLVTMDMTKDVMTNVKTANAMKAPIGQFVNVRSYPDATFHDVTAPNADTLYSVAWLDLSFEPYVLHLPDANDRYYIMPLLSGWTDVFASLGTRTTGTKEQNYTITGPDWKGEVPANIKEIKSPTNMVWILGRTYSTGTPEDYKIVHELQDQYSLTPLSFFGKPYKPHDGIVQSGIDTKTPVRTQVNNLTASAFFKKLTMLLEDNPPAKADREMIAKMAKIGIVPGAEFDVSKLDSKNVKIFENIPKQAQEKIMFHEKDAGTILNGWIVTFKTGTYGTDYLQRAFITAIGLGANLPEDAVYPSTKNEYNSEKLLNGKNNYVIHFPKGQTPPVKGFWSLTMYNKEYFFVANPLNRYTLSPRNDLKYNEDGSLDLFIQNIAPSKDKQSNWLQSPADDFILMFRFYWPEQAILNQTWKPPVLEVK
jgi:DNA sulfur modification protein DndE